MHDKNELQEFDLDDILSEFRDLPEEEASDLEASASVSMDTGRMNELISQLEQQREEEEEAAKAAVSMDTGRMNDLIAEIMEQAEPVDHSNDTVRLPDKDASNEATRRMEAVTADPPKTAEPTAEETLRMDSVSQEETRRIDPIEEEPTRRMDPLEPPVQEE